MGKYILKRSLLTIPVLFGITLVVFLMMHLIPGDPVLMMLGESGVFSPERVDELRESLGFNKPLIVQYFGWVKGIFQGNLGYSYIRHQPINSLILEVIPYTISLALASLAVAIVVGVGLGLLAAVKVNTWVDSASMFFSLLGVSMPAFWLGLMLIFTLSLRMGLLPSTGVGGWQRMIMPVVTLGLTSSATIARLVRTSILEVMRSDYVRTARAKGVSQFNVIILHVLRNALIPVVTIVGLQFGRMLAGAVVIEQVFTRPGLGRLVVTAIQSKDFQVVQAGVLISALVYLAVNLLVDLLYAWIDPRISFS